MDERKCESNRQKVTVDSGSTRYVYDLDGRKHDKGSKTPERKAIVEMTITCQRCAIQDQLRAEGDPPYGASNEADRLSKRFLIENCPKWKEFKTKQAELANSSFAYLYRDTLNITADTFFSK